MQLLRVERAAGSGFTPEVIEARRQADKGAVPSLPLAGPPIGHAGRDPTEEAKAMTKMIANGDVELATEAFGDPANPPVLLIMGAMASMLWWPEDFCQALASRGRFVIRYDNRDTGLSTVYEPGHVSYSKEDMADDAFAVLDAYGVDDAHIVGMSLGGMIAQLAAFSRQERVRTLTLISTSPMGVDTTRLPGMSDAYEAHGAEGERWTGPTLLR
jgi:pimeloyl-ACP methyl ester carboxylesterase